MQPVLCAKTYASCNCVWVCGAVYLSLRNVQQTFRCYLLSVQQSRQETSLISLVSCAQIFRERSAVSLSLFFRSICHFGCLALFELHGWIFFYCSCLQSKTCIVSQVGYSPLRFDDHHILYVSVLHLSQTFKHQWRKMRKILPDRYCAL